MRIRVNVGYKYICTNHSHYCSSSQTPCCHYDYYSIFSLTTKHKFWNSVHMFNMFNVTSYKLFFSESANSQLKINYKMNPGQTSVSAVPAPLSYNRFNPTLGAQICHHIRRFLFSSQHRLLLLALIYPGNICQAHILSFINTLLHTYTVTHIHIWQLPSATTVF